MDHPDHFGELLTLVAQPVPDRGYAVVRRRGTPGLELLIGAVIDVDTLDDIPLPSAGEPPVLAAVPFRQVRERGFTCHDDGAPLRCLVADRRTVLDDVALARLVERLPDTTTRLDDAAFTLDDLAYADVVKRVVEDEIGRGEGANFVVRRDLIARIDSAAPGPVALRVLSRLLAREPNAYWSFAVGLGDLVMVGASPERHVSLTGGQLTMNPVSGTYRYPSGRPDREDLLAFLRDVKEIEELSMVLDEELKMMSAVCSDGGRVHGPVLTGMGALAHTAYDLVGRCRLDPREALRRTMFAATLTGSPVENACRVIADHEGDGRGHYGAVLARFERVGDDVDLDAPILIRTAYLRAGEGHLRVRIPVGATLVRHSVPEHEVAETHAKITTLVRAFEPDTAATGSTTTATPGPALMADPDVQAVLAARNRDLAPFWLRPQRPDPVPALAGRRVLLVDAEDEWTAMLAHLCRHLGLTADVRRWDAVRPGELDRADLVVAGPGPGDPRQRDRGRLDRLRSLVEDRLESSAPLLAVCLSHQLLAARLGLPLAPLPSPHQGTQRRLDLLGRRVRVGFYNTFSAWTDAELPDPMGRFDLAAPSLPGAHGWAVPGTGEVLALRVPSARAASVQCHLESVLSPDGAALLSELLTGLSPDPPGGRVTPG